MRQLGRLRGTRATALLSVVAVVGAVGCAGAVRSGGDDGVERTSASASSSPSASASGTPAADAADPKHAVADPGPLRLPLRSADLLVVDSKPLTERTLERMRELKGVRSVTPLSIAKIPVESKALTVAAVDAASYRRLTPQTSAQAQSVWKRVAGGEMAVVPSLGPKLPLTKDGYLALGDEEKDARIHVGAYAPQVPSIDLVVNDSWGKALGMRLGNAAIISTGITSPSRVSKPLKRLVSGDASIQGLDAVARYGLDPGATQNAFVVGSAADAVGTFTYSVIGGGRIAPAAAWVRTHIATETMPIIGSMTCNKAVFPQLRAALQEIQQVGLADKIHVGEYAGCYYPRFIAGTTTLSNHSFGLAFDINTPGNQRGTVGEIDRGVVAIFKKWGFAWGGDWNYTDPMHFELARLVAPR